MASIFPCRGCPLREGCELREEFRKRTAGTGATRIAFRCERLKAEIRPGRRIVITAPIFGAYEYDGSRDFSRREVTATIRGVSDRYQFSCVVDPGQIAEEEVAENADAERIRFRKTQKHTRIARFLDEPDIAPCEFGNFKQDGKCDTPDGRCTCAENAALVVETSDDLDVHSVSF